MKPFNIPIQALLICGGDSSRMGKPKALLNYHGMPQYKWLQVMCQQLQIPAFISCKQEQKDWYEQGTPLIFDLEKYASAGPMSGLLSAMEQLPALPLFLIGCDYPLLSIKDMMHLIQSFERVDKTCAFYQSKKGLFEPLLAIYHPKDFLNAKQHYQDRQHSLQNFLRGIGAEPILPLNELAYKSFDTPEDFLSFR